jgi:hypothetical protein
MFIEGTANELPGSASKSGALAPDLLAEHGSSFDVPSINMPLLTGAFPP